MLVKPIKYTIILLILAGCAKLNSKIDSKIDKISTEINKIDKINTEIQNLKTINDSSKTINQVWPYVFIVFGILFVFLLIFIRINSYIYQKPKYLKKLEKDGNIVR